MNQAFIVDARDQSLRDAIFRFRYEVLVGEQRKHPRYADHLRKCVHEPLDDCGWLFVKMQNGRVTGTARVNEFNDLQDPVFLQRFNASLIERFQLRDQAIVASRMIVSSASRGSKIFYELVTCAFREVLRNNRSLLIMECAPVYEPLFRKVGFVCYGPPFLHPDGMMVSPMVLDGNNVPWLRSIGSPCVDHYPPGFLPDAALGETIAEYCSQLGMMGSSR